MVENMNGIQGQNEAANPGQSKNDIPYRAKLCRAKVTNFLTGDENFARRIVSPDENFARQSFAR